MKKPISIVWFRKDLRLTDNLAFYGAANCSDILPIYIFDDLDVQGSASNVWLNHSLAALDNSLDQRLNVYHGKSDEIIDRLIAQYAVKQIFMNICYEPEMRLQEQKVRKICDKHNVVLNNSSSNYLQKPEVLLKNDGTPYKVFTPFKKRLQQLNLRSLVPKPHVYSCIKDPNAAHIFIKPTGWALKVISNWTPGENAAQIVLKEFICNGLKGYGSSRNMVAEKHISRLSPYLHFGEISVFQILDQIENATVSPEDKEMLYSELVWREFSAYLLAHFPKIDHEPFLQKFKQYGWTENAEYLKRWQRGQTGYPIIDAGMRELWNTGYMHNRVRMIVASFLVKNLNIHWHHGRDWFWDCLFDADLASNSVNWQWVTGCGVDPSPFFRIFNPTTQAENFDPTGEYIKMHVPELRNMPLKYLFEPWTAPKELQVTTGIIVGQTYPNPIVDLRLSRENALKRYQLLIDKK